MIYVEECLGLTCILSWKILYWPHEVKGRLLDRYFKHFFDDTFQVPDEANIRNCRCKILAFGFNWMPRDTRICNIHDCRQVVRVQVFDDVIGIHARGYKSSTHLRTGPNDFKWKNCNQGISWTALDVTLQNRGLPWCNYQHRCCLSGFALHKIVSSKPKSYWLS